MTSAADSPEVDGRTFMAISQVPISTGGLSQPKATSRGLVQQAELRGGRQAGSDDQPRPRALHDQSGEIKTIELRGAATRCTLSHAREVAALIEKAAKRLGIGRRHESCSRRGALGLRSDARRLGRYANFGRLLVRRWTPS